ncbi:ABC transporter ATP-binding protein [Saccharopolyspora gregorii]|uniref:ABC transporter ATP-binding protein n=1 Tax=Saccharopolyspora gregorii TaxID=33914 RepID=UPI0021ABED7A|nr:ABC transporter ATP-binding protein [Saccharopolyspora gregorii]
MTASRSGTESMLTGTDLVCSFGATPALRGADLAVDAGEVVAVVGASGSGKSTLLHCMAGVVAPESGTVRFRGRDVTAMSDDERSALRRSEFGFVFQFGQLVPELSVLENIALPLRLNGAARSKSERRARDWADKLGVTAQLDKRPGEISGGQGQRAALARALVADPSVIFADEPTGALDSTGGREVMQLLTETASESGSAVVLVTHEPTVAAYAHREVVIRDGRTALAEETAR